MDKYGVVLNPELIKTGSKTPACPGCGAVVVSPFCSNCGTKPFEKRPEPDPKK